MAEEINYDANSVLEALNNKADRDLKNITDGTYDFLTTKQITNCITKIPQDIKLELNNGTLTLKAGSKVYVPNGVGVFDEIVIDVDKTLTISVDGTHFVTLNSVQNLAFNPVNKATSGTQSPTSSGYWYDTNENKIKYYSGSAFNEYYYSLPLCIVTASGGVATSIDQVFNGFGYIGSTIFALPDVEGLIPNGRNADGSLNNIKLKTTAVSVSPTYPTGFSSGKQYLFIYNENAISDNGYFYDSVAEPSNWTLKVWFDIENNLIKFKDSSGNIVLPKATMFGTCSVENGRITSFSPKYAFQAVDRNDTEWTSTQGKPSNRYINLTLQASGTQYTAPANGYVLVAGTKDWIDIAVLSNALGFCAGGRSSDGFARGFAPVKKGEAFTVYYGSAFVKTNFRFIYDEGSK